MFEEICWSLHTHTQMTPMVFLGGERGMLGYEENRTHMKSFLTSLSSLAQMRERGGKAKPASERLLEKDRLGKYKVGHKIKDQHVKDKSAWEKRKLEVIVHLKRGNIVGCVSFR